MTQAWLRLPGLCCFLIVLLCAGAVPGLPGHCALAAEPAANDMPAAADRLFPADDSWGLPPQKDWPKEIIANLDYSGWYRWLGTLPACGLLALGPDRVVISTDLEIAAYALADGALLWSSPRTDALYPDQVVASSEFLVIKEYRSETVLSLKDGRLQTIISPSSVQQSADWQVMQPREINIIEPGEEYVPQEPLPAAQRLAGFGLTAVSELHSRDWQIVLCESYPAGHDYWGANSHLCVLRLDEQGQPASGSTAMLQRPVRPAELVDAFYSNPAPIRDAALMQRMVAGGLDAFLGALERIETAPGPQLDALMGLAAYSTLHQTEEYSALPPVYPFFKKLNQWREPSLVPRLTAWAQRPELERAVLDLLGLLANIGTSEAGAYLHGYYDGLLIHEHSTPPPPYRIVEGVDLGGDTWQPDELPPAHISRLRLADGSELSAFVADGLASAREVFLGVDQNADGACEEILPSGLTDTYFFHMHPGGIHELYGQPTELQLHQKDGKLTLFHHRPQFKEEGGEGGPGDTRRFQRMNGATVEGSTIELAALRSDSDGDGLTNVLEELMLLDPQKPDTDGDGLPDAQDFAPNVDQAAMGKVERGAARALAYYFQVGPRNGYWWQTEQSANPWSARYISVEGMGPVAYTGNPEAYGICLPHDAARDYYKMLLEGYNSYSRLDILYLPSMPDAGGGSDSGGSIGPGGDFLMALSSMGQPQSPQGSAPVLGARSGLVFNFPLQGFFIQLVEIDGELYPVDATMTWIS